jgi:chorismate mutase
LYGNARCQRQLPGHGLHAGLPPRGGRFIPFVMSSPVVAAAEDPLEPPANDLLRLRKQLDVIDDAMHDLLLQRAAVVEEVSRLGQKGRIALRPGREAAIVRRLLGRHSGRFPRSSLVRVWRELIGGMTSLQGPYAFAVCDPDPAAAFTAATREQFGALVALRAYRTPAQAIGEISAGSAAAAVLPMPAEGEPASAAWWTALLHKDDPRIHVVGRLPFWAPRPEGAPKVNALVVSAVAPDPSGNDRTLLGLEVSLEHSRARLSQALATAGLQAGTTILRRDPGAAMATVLVDVAGFVGEADPRLPALARLSTARPPVVLGAYAVPLQGESP